MTRRRNPVEDTRSWRTWLFIIVCSLIAGCSSTKDEDPGGSATSLSGKWRAEHKQSEDQILIMVLEFHDSGKFSTNPTLKIPKSEGSSEMHEYPGMACDFTYESVDDTHWDVTMVSKKIEGKERITPEDKTPQRWTCQRPSETELIISQPHPFGTGKKRERELHFHRID